MSGTNRMWCLGFSTTRTIHRRAVAGRSGIISSFSFQQQRQQPQLQPMVYRNYVSKLYLELDEQGRTIRKRPTNEGGGNGNDGDDDDYVTAKGYGRRGTSGGRTSNDWEDNRESTRSSKSSRRNQDYDAALAEFGVEDYSPNSRRRPLDKNDNEVVTPRYVNNNDDDDDNNAFDSWDGERSSSPPPRRDSAPRRGPVAPKRFGNSNRWDDRSSSSSSSASRFGRRDGGGGGDRRDGGGDRRVSGDRRVGGGDRGDGGGGDRRSSSYGSSSTGSRYGSQFASSSPPTSTRMGGGTGGGRFNLLNSNNVNNNRWNDGSTAEDAAAAQQGRTNMKALEAAGFVHLYGLSSCLNALRANQRDLSVPQEETDRIQQLQQASMNGDDEEEVYQDPENDASRKPEAQLRSWLFVLQQQQDQPSGSSSRSSDKAQMAEDILRLAKERNVPVAYVDRGVLNTLSGNRPHQGYVLRCGKLSFESLSRIPLPDPSTESATKLWLVLDEVVDPQNLGALIRTSYFLGNVGVLVCAKNSAPPSAVVSAASVGALEVATIFSTANLPRTLQQAQQDGFRIIGASSSPPTPIRRTVRSAAAGGDEDSNEEGQGSDTPNVYDLQDLPATDQPTLLVLGSEGHGLRTLVARACTEFVRIPSGNTEDHESVDSLNVSVTGGILLWHLLRGQRN